MKFHVSEIRRTKGFRKFVLLVISSLLLTTIPLYILNISPFALYTPEPSSISSIPLSPLHTLEMTANDSKRVSIMHKGCNMFRGEWVPDAKGTSYNNASKCAIDDRQNCMKFGRPDRGFMKWRWKPDHCELSHFDGKEFLELVRGKSMAFVGDSVGRNQIESLMCLLANVAYTVDAPSLEGAMARWFYRDYNFTLAMVWSPNLVKFSNENRNGSSIVGLLNLYLDKVDKGWTSKIEDFDYVIISVGHWFSRPLIYHEKGKVIGCHACQDANITSLSRYYGYRKALRTAFRAILGLTNFKGVTILRTFSPTHFGSEDWVKGGNCLRTTPFKKEEAVIDANNLEYYLTQVDEFKAAETAGRKRGLKFMLLDVFEAMGMRPDGHPYHYGHPQNKKEAIADCLHWCLPGPIDSWNEFLLHMLKVEVP